MSLVRWHASNEIAYIAFLGLKNSLNAHSARANVIANPTHDTSIGTDHCEIWKVQLFMARTKCPIETSKNKVPEIHKYARFFIFSPL